MIKVFALKAKNNLSLKSKEILAQKNLYDPRCTNIFRDDSVILVSNGESHKESILKVNDNVVVSDCFISNRRQLLLNYELDTGLTCNELIIHLYKKMGSAFVEVLEGQFSIIIYNIITKELHAFTDQFGINPLYYSIQENTDFFISSEIKGFKNLSFFKKSLNHKRIYDYLTTLTSVPDLTFYDNVYKIKKSHYLHINESYKCTFKKYYELSPAKYNFRDYNDCVSQFSEVFTNTISEYESEANNFSSITSGGLDSTSISCILSEISRNQVKSYSSVFSSQNHDFTNTNEDKYVKEVLQYKNLNHTFIKIENTGPFNFLINYDNDSDMPLYNSNLYVMDPILKNAKKSGFNYIFDGLDGDVVISHGYDELSRLARSFQFKSFLSLYKKTCSQLNKKPNYRSAFKTFFFKTYISSKHLEKYRALKNNYLYEELNMMRLNKKLHSKDLYSLINRNYGYERGKYFNPLTSHLNTLNSNIWEMVFSHIYETRSAHNIKTLMPFFSKRIVEFSLSVNSSYKLKDGYDRAYFRDAMKLSVPRVILEKTSKGDLSPMGVLDFKSKKSFIMEFLLKDNYYNQIIDKEKLAKDFFSDSAIEENRKILPVYDLVALKMWLKKEMLEINPEELRRHKHNI